MSDEGPTHVSGKEIAEIGGLFADVLSHVDVFVSERLTPAELDARLERLKQRANVSTAVPTVTPPAALELWDMPMTVGANVVKRPATAGHGGSGAGGSLTEGTIEEASDIEDVVGYRGVTACAAAGVTYRQLDYWARTGLVVPSVRAASGSGTQRLYSFRDIVVLKVVKRLLNAGVSLQNIRKAIETVRQWGEGDLATMTLISDGTTVYECRSAEEVVDLLQGGQGVFAIAISGAFKEIQGSLADMPARTSADKADEETMAPDELAARRARRRAG